MYNRERRCYDMTYICSKGTTRLEVRKEGGRHRLHGAGGAIQPMAVCRGDRGHLPLQNVTKQAEGFQVNCEVFARRIQ